MDRDKNEVFWLQYPFILFKEIKFVPKEKMSYEEQVNCITRLVIFIFLIMYLLGSKHAILFLLLSIIFIIILYYLQKSKMTTCEPYKEKMNYNTKYNMIDQLKKTDELYRQGVKEYKTNRYTVEKFPSYYSNERIEAEKVVPNQTYFSKNQRLAGPANPKTLVAPVVAPPSYDWTYWKVNDFVFPSIINEKRTQDYYGSGYFTSDEPIEKPIRENYVEKAIPSTQQIYQDQYRTPQKPMDYLGNYNGKYPTPIDNGSDLGSSNVVPKDVFVKDNSHVSDSTFFRKRSENINYPGNVNRSCTYDPTNLDYNLPSNFMAGNCERNDKLKEFNDELFTSTINPGVYYKTQIIEPLNYNVGISFDQQIPPRKVSKDKNGNITYTAMDPDVYEPLKEKDTHDYGTAPYEVYDPRTNGYGTSYREYEHEITGQPRFYYDDVNAARRPNYITRTNIDHLLKADSYGIVQSNNDIMSRNCNSRKIAEEGLLDDTIDFRTDLMTRLMRKRNAELWQQRLAPLQKGGNFTMSGTKR